MELRERRVRNKNLKIKRKKRQKKSIILQKEQNNTKNLKRLSRFIKIY